MRWTKAVFLLCGLSNNGGTKKQHSNTDFHSVISEQPSLLHFHSVFQSLTHSASSPFGSLSLYLEINHIHATPEQRMAAVWDQNGIRVPGGLIQIAFSLCSGNTNIL